MKAKRASRRTELDWPNVIGYGQRPGAQVAQLVEHATENRSVGGSIPPLGTIFSMGYEVIWFRFRTKFRTGPRSSLKMTGVGRPKHGFGPPFLLPLFRLVGCGRVAKGASPMAVAA